MMRKLLLASASALCLLSTAAQAQWNGCSAGFCSPGSGGYSSGGGGGGGGSFTPTFQYQNSVFASGNPPSQNFTSVPLGTASSDRIVVVEAYVDQGTLSAPTICGVTGTQDVLYSGGYFGAWHANITSGTSCTITANGNALKDVGIAVWTISGQTGGGAATPSNSNTLSTGGSEPISFPFTDAVGGATMMSAYCLSATTNTFTWTVVTPVGTNVLTGAGGATPVLSSAQGTTSGTATGTTGAGKCNFGNGFFVYDSWGP